MEELLIELRRIADAMEEGNAINREWITLNAQWREEVERINAESREWHRAHEEKVFDQSQDWIDWQKQQRQKETDMAAKFAEENNKELMRLYASHLFEQ